MFDDAETVCAYGTSPPWKRHARALVARREGFFVRARGRQRPAAGVSWRFFQKPAWSFLQRIVEGCDAFEGYQFSGDDSRIRVYFPVILFFFRGFGEPAKLRKMEGSRARARRIRRRTWAPGAAQDTSCRQGSSLEVSTPCALVAIVNKRCGGVFMGWSYSDETYAVEPGAGFYSDEGVLQKRAVRRAFARHGDAACAKTPGFELETVACDRM